jgi:thiol-disulfide isomerase/thioredoxin
MTERLLLALVLLAIGFVAYRLWVARQKRTANARVSVDPLFSDVQPGLPVILYFTTPMCVSCKTQQVPALERLRQEAAVQIIKVDATENPTAAERWGVFSVPTTFVIDTNGRTLAVNHGVANFKMLKSQLSG